MLLHSQYTAFDVYRSITKHRLELYDLTPSSKVHRLTDNGERARRGAGAGTGPRTNLLQARHLRRHTRDDAPLTQLRRRWVQRSVAARLLRERRAIDEAIPPERDEPAASRQPFTSAVEDEHHDMTDRGHGELGRPGVRQHVIALGRGFVQAGPVW